jgi:hypothetical protein
MGHQPAVLIGVLAVLLVLLWCPPTVWWENFSFSSQLENANINPTWTIDLTNSDDPVETYRQLIEVAKVPLKLEEITIGFNTNVDLVADLVEVFTRLGVEPPANAVPHEKISSLQQLVRKPWS